MSKRNNKHGEDNRKVSESGLRGKWSEDEDELLRDGVNELGKQWTEISRRILGRTGVDCCRRWEYYLRPDLIKGSWSSEVS